MGPNFFGAVVIYLYEYLIRVHGHTEVKALHSIRVAITPNTIFHYLCAVISDIKSSYMQMRWGLFGK